MSTFLEMQQRIADDLNRSDLTTQIKKAITRAISFYQKEPFWFKETSATFSTIANQQAYSSTDTSITDILTIKRLAITVSGTQYEVRERDINYILNTNPSAATGDPSTEYAWWQNKIYLSLIPNQIRTATIYYTKSYTALSADADTNDWTTYAEDLIENRARWWVNFRVLKDRDAAADDKVAELESLQGLREISAGYTSQGRILPTCF